MARALREVMMTIEYDSEARAVVLRGSGDGFMAGGDVSSFHAHLSRDIERYIVEITHELHAAVISLRRMPKPVVASVHGACAGAGFSIAMASDLVIAADNAAFTVAYARIGASPDGSSTFFLPRLVGFHRAMELIMLSDRYDAEFMQSIGLINWVVPIAELEAETENIASRLANGPTAAFARSKELIGRSLASSLESQLDAEAQSISASGTSQDFSEGVRAFLEKRRPNFVGR